MWKKIIILLLLSILSCKNSSNNKTISEELFVEVKLNDTFIKNKYNKGEFRIASYSADSVKKTDKDYKFARLYVSITNKNIKEVLQIECDTFYAISKTLKDTLIIPFYVKSNKIGKLNFSSLLDVEYILAATKFKDSTKKVVVTHRYNFTKSVYVKDDNIDKPVAK
jgi:hypothetical protein